MTVLRMLDPSVQVSMVVGVRGRERQQWKVVVVRYSR